MIRFLSEQSSLFDSDAVTVVDKQGTLSGPTILRHYLRVESRISVLDNILSSIWKYDGLRKFSFAFVVHTASQSGYMRFPSSVWPDAMTSSWFTRGNYTANPHQIGAPFDSELW